MCNLYNTALTLCLVITIAGKIIQIDPYDELPPDNTSITVCSDGDAHVSFPRLQNDEQFLY